MGPPFLRLEGLLSKGLGVLFAEAGSLEGLGFSVEGLPVRWFLGFIGRSWAFGFFLGGSSMNPEASYNSEFQGLKLSGCSKVWLSFKAFQCMVYKP